MAAPSQQLLLEAVKGVLTSGNYSDLEISCKSDTYKVHKVIVCSRSRFFSNAVGFGGQETHDSKISLDDDEPDVIKLLLQYSYEGEYNPELSIVTESVKCDNRSPVHSCMYDRWESPCRDYICAHHQCGRDCSHNCVNFTCMATTGFTTTESLPKGEQQPLTHSQMYECADKYDVAGLKDLAKKKFKVACDASWNDATFAAAVSHAFTTTPDNDMGLRDVVIETLKNHLELIDKPEIQVLLTEFNGLAFSILKQKKADGWK